MRNIILSILLTIATTLVGQQNEKDSFKTLLEKEIETIQKSNGDLLLQGNFTDILTGFTQNEFHNELEEQWLEIANAPHPSVNTIRKYLKKAAKEFSVPFELLDAIAKTYNNYAMIGPSKYGSWGIMGLVQNNYCSNLTLAATLIDANPEKLQYNFKENIRGAAALLAHFNKKNSQNPADWFEATKEFSGMLDDELKEMQAIDYYKTLNKGASSITLWKEDATIKSLQNNEIAALISKYNKKTEQKIARSKASVDYPGAIGEFTTCNYSSRGGTDINCWVNHYIGTGTVAGAVSWFKNCNARASAHFTISRYGTIYQSVKVYSKAWHAGASGQANNERSIGVEHDATAANPQTWNMNSMLKPSAEMAAYFCDIYNIPKVRKYRPNYGAGICGHNDMPGTNTSCPGPLPWSTWFDFLEGGLQNTPVPEMPAKNATNVPMPVSLSWNSPVGANAFRVQVSKSNSGWTETDGFTSANFPNETVVVNASIAEDSFYWAEGEAGTTAGPKSNTTYYWTVRSWDGETGTSKYSEVRTFATEIVKFEKVWARTDVNGNMPYWFSASGNSERGLAYFGNHLFVVSRNNGLSVKLLNSNDGADAGELSIAGISGGVYALNDIETSWDGQVLACNLTVDASGSAFKIYKWTNETSSPQQFISFSGDNVRLGDSFTVLGNVSQNAVIYAGAANTNKVVRWVIINGIVNTAEVIALQSVGNIGTAPEVVPFGVSPSEDFMVNGTTISATQFTANGNYVGKISGGVIPGYSNASQMLINGGKRYYVTFQNNPNTNDPNSQNIRLTNITNGVSNVVASDVYGVSKKLGNNPNYNCTGDVAIKHSLNPEDIIIY
jgi:N-acetyl-anhydromuramyl-L-alanine amidase AmpD